MPPLSAEKQVQIEEEFAALANNVAAVLAVSASVERTLGPKGLDTLLVDRLGDILVTNSGVTILERMDISHPAARMLLQVAKAQHAEVGDGTTTATVMASTILKEGLNQISRGVPVSRILEGIQKATAMALEIIRDQIARPVKNLSDPVLVEVAYIAGRGHRDVAERIALAAKTLGDQELRNPGFRLADIILAKEGGRDELLPGVIVPKTRVSTAMPSQVSPSTVLVLLDSLVPDEIEEEALHTEAGFRKSLELRSQFAENLQKLLRLGINAVFAEGGLHPEAEELLAHEGVLVVRRVNARELLDVASFTGAIPLKRSGLQRPPAELRSFLGKASRIEEDEKTRSIRVTGGNGKSRATLLLGAATQEIAEEKERKAKDAASSFQAAVLCGVIPGGGASELATARILGARRNEFTAMTSYGLDCILEGLKKPFLQMAANAGFNPFEKAEEVFHAQSKERKNSISIHFETGALADMQKEKIFDPALTKLHALASASEVAQAILRINKIIKMRDNGVKENGHA